MDDNADPALRKAALRYKAVTEIQNHFDKRANQQKEQYVSKARAFEPASDSAYPLRDVWGNSILIVSIDEFSSKSTSKNRYREPELFRRFVQNERRGEGYALTDCVKFTKDHLRDPYELPLLRQNTMVAKKDIPAGTCLGIYTGFLVKERHLADMMYLMSTGDTYPELFIDGRGVLSRMNTIFKYDEHGRPQAQAESGYDVDLAAFNANLANGNTIQLPVAYAKHDISKGTDMRMNYLYTPKLIEVMNKQHKAHLRGREGSGRVS